MPTQNYILTLGFLVIVLLAMLLHQRFLMREQVNSLSLSFQQERETLTLSLQLLLSQLTQEKERTAQLTNLLMSKDAMTYTTLQSQTLSTSSRNLDSDYVSTGTDDAEFIQFAEQSGVLIDDDYRADVRLAFGDGDGDAL